MGVAPRPLTNKDFGSARYEPDLKSMFKARRFVATKLPENPHVSGVRSATSTPSVFSRKASESDRPVSKHQRFTLFLLFQPTTLAHLQHEQIELVEKLSRLIGFGGWRHRRSLHHQRNVGPFNCRPLGWTAAPTCRNQYFKASHHTRTRCSGPSFYPRTNELQSSNPQGPRAHRRGAAHLNMVFTQGPLLLGESFGHERRSLR